MISKSFCEKAAFIIWGVYVLFDVGMSSTFLLLSPEFSYLVQLEYWNTYKILITRFPFW